MADAHMWLRCTRCKATNRLVSYSGGWGVWSAESTGDFLMKHIEECWDELQFSPDTKEKFFELIGPAIEVPE